MNRFNAYPMAANATHSLNVGDGNPSVDTHGFLCTTAGNFKLALGADGSGASLVPTVAVTAGMYLRIPATFGVPCAVVLSGGAVGTLFASA